MRAIKVYCPPGVEPPLYAFIDALDGKLKAMMKSSIARNTVMISGRPVAITMPQAGLPAMRSSRVRFSWHPRMN